MSETKSPPGLTLPEHPRYAVVEKIAQGAFATVFRGRDMELNREVAIKQIHAQYLEDPHQLDRYWQEAQLIANLEHARIISIYDIVRDRGWLILELMMGSIQQVLKGRPIDLTDLRYLLRAVAQGLQFLERNGIIHGDVKPSNILLDKNRQIRLGDFGIARRLSSGEGSVVKGTAKYMAPEVVSDQFGEVGPHSDLYSLGFSAYELMCGQNFESLFPGLNMFGRDRQVAWMMWQSAPDRRLPEIRRVLQNVPEDLAGIVEKLCEKDPAKRYRTAEQLLQDLDQDKTRDRQPTAQEAAEAEKAAKQARRKRLMAVGALAVSLTLSVALALWPSREQIIIDGDDHEPSQGTLVLVDLPHGRLQLETPGGGVGEIPVNPGQDMFILNETEVLTVQQLQPGDPISVKRLESDGKVIQRIFSIQRAVATETRGRIASVEALTHTITITPDDSVQRLPAVLVPSSATILLNGSAVPLDSLRAGDRVLVKCVPYKDGLKAESLDAERLIEGKGMIEAIRLPSHVTVRQPDSSIKELQVDGECRVTLNERPAGAEGRTFTLADLRKDDEVSLQHDRVVRRIDAKRVLIVSGKIEKADFQAKRIDVRQDNQSLRSLSVAEDCVIQLAPDRKPPDSPTGTAADASKPSGELPPDSGPLDLAALRAGDAVTIVEDSRDGRARRIEVVLAPDRGCWAVVIGQSRHDDRRVTPSAAVLPGAERIRQTLLRRARVVTEQLLWLPESTRFGMHSAVTEFLKRVPSEGRLLVYFAGRAAKSEQGDVYLALRDFDPSRAGETGQDLAALLKSLDEVKAAEKVFLFDVQYGGEDGRWQPAAAELIETLKARKGSVSQTVYVIANCSRGEVNGLAEGGKAGLFAACTAEALQGKADFDRDQRVTPPELFRYLKIQVPTCALRAGREQDPVLFEPAPAVTIAPEALASLRRLLELAGSGRKVDDELAMAYHKAAALIPDQPDAHLIYALATMRDRLRSKLAQDRFEEVVAKYPDHPNSTLAYHALAWLCFLKQDFDGGLVHLERAVSLAPNPNDPYARELFGFAGQLSGFAHCVVADPNLRPRLSQVFQAAQNRGEEAERIFRDKLNAVQKDVETRDRQIQETPDDVKRKSLEFDKKNPNRYAKFDFDSAFSFIEQSLDTPR